MSKDENKKLIEKFHWLTPSNRWSGKWIDECADGEEGYWPGTPDKLPEYDYEYTELDAMPKGWRKSFGIEMCEEIQKELDKLSEKERNEFRVTQIKEKFGELRFYTNFGTDGLYKVINKYTDKSRKICIECGQPAKWESLGWISPFCDDCAKKIYMQRYVDEKKEYPFDEMFRSIE